MFGEALPEQQQPQCLLEQQKKAAKHVSEFWWEKNLLENFHNLKNVQTTESYVLKKKSS